MTLLPLIALGEKKRKKVFFFVILSFIQLQERQRKRDKNCKKKPERALKVEEKEKGFRLTVFVSDETNESVD